MCVPLLVAPPPPSSLSHAPFCEMTRQDFTCHGHYFGRIWNWFVENLVARLYRFRSAYYSFTLKAI